MRDDRKNEIRLNLIGATCPSCRHAIQHTGSKMEGVEKIEIDPVDGKISLTYNGDRRVVENIQDLVDKLGYKAVPEES